MGGQLSSLNPLNESELEAALVALPGWEVIGGRLHSEFRFAGFSEAFGFMAATAVAAERLDHHPNWSNVWNTVTVDLWTHDAGAITELDISLASKMTELANRLA